MTASMSDPISVPSAPTSEPAPVPAILDTPEPSTSTVAPDIVYDPPDDLPIALRKGKRTCTYPISSYVSYNHLSPPFYSFIASLDSITVPTTFYQALAHPG